MEDFQTPREAALAAENARLKAENAYLRQAVNEPYLKFTPIGVIEELPMRALDDVIRLPCAASIKGNLMRHGNYHVIATLNRAQPENLTIQYHAPAVDIKGRADYFVNELFPFLHQRFISALANAIHPPRAAA